MRTREPKGIAASNAACVIAAPSAVPFHAPVTISVRPVSVQIIIVSMNVPVIETSPCSAGHFTLAAAAAIGALPSPDSFENTPLAMPLRMAIMTVAPRNPPPAAVALKALWKTSDSASGILSANAIRTMALAATYTRAIAGTTLVVTLAILWRPPIVTRATARVTTPAVTATGIPRLDSLEDTIAFTWGRVPIPKRATNIPLIEK